jgi:hypothetical protein
MPAQQVVEMRWVPNLICERTRKTDCLLLMEFARLPAMLENPIAVSFTSRIRLAILR